MSWFSDQLAAGLGVVADAAGEPVTYYDGSNSVSLAKAVPRRIIPQAGQEFEQHILSTGRIWDVKKSLMVADSVAITPQRGHTIEEADGTVWEVLDNPITGKCWDYVDGGKAYIKIFTKQKAI